MRTDPSVEMQSAESSGAARGIVLKLSAVALFTIMSACVKAAREVAPTGEVVFFRSFFALPPIVIWALWRGGSLRAAFRARDPLAHAMRGVIGVMAMTCGFMALGLLPLPEVIAIGYATPLIATGLAALLLREQVRLFRWTAVGVGLIGVVVMLWPRLTLFRGGMVDDMEALGAGLALAGATLGAFATIQIRHLTRTETTLSIVFWFTLTCTIAGALTAPFGWAWPSGKAFVLLIASGLLGGVAQILMTEGYARADASTLAPFDYASLLFGLVIGFVVFAEIPNTQVLVGAAIVVGAGLYIIHRERRLRIDRSKPRSAGGMNPPGA